MNLPTIPPPIIVRGFVPPARAVRSEWGAELQDAERRKIGFRSFPGDRLPAPFVAACPTRWLPLNSCPMAVILIRKERGFNE